MSAAPEAGALLREKIQSRTARAGVIGLGYVGLPLAVELARAGFHVTGIDTDAAKIALLKKGQNYIEDVDGAVLGDLVRIGRLAATGDFAGLAHLDTVNICVPTPLRKTKDPDMSYVVEAAEQVAKYLHPGMLIILESTTYPGTTEELILPMLEREVCARVATFSCAFPPSGSIPEIPNSRRATFRKWWAASPRIPPRLRRRCTRRSSSAWFA